MPYSKKQALMKFHSGWAEVERVPALVLVDAHDAVAEVVVLADDVGVGVVQLVVAVLPLLGRRGVVPLPGGRVDLRVAHPVPLAVHDVVADLHVLEDLGDRRGRRCRRARPAGRCENSSTARLPSSSLRCVVDDLADVRRVVGAAGVDDVLADRVELAAELLDVLGGQVGDRVVGFFWMTVMVTPSVVERSRRSVVDVAGAGGGVDAGLDEVRRRRSRRGRRW